MGEDTRSPAELAADIDAARERLAGFVAGCTDTDWRSVPLDGDPRPVGVVVDHVAHAYEYLAGWMRQLVTGQPVDVNNEVVDALNAEHARTAGLGNQGRGGRSPAPQRRRHRRAGRGSVRRRPGRR